MRMHILSPRAHIGNSFLSTNLLHSSPLSKLLFLGVIATLASLASLLSLVSPTWAQGKLEPATLRLDWLASGYHAPFFLALERGYYRDQGIELVIQDGKGSTSTIQAVASGSDTFATANLSATALGITRGIPLVAIAALIQKSPDSVIALANSGIKTPKDIEGKRGAFVTTGAGDRIFPAFAKAAGIETDKVTKIQIASSARYSVLLQGNADFVIGWSFTDAYKINKERPIAPPILFADHGINLLSVGVVVSKDTLANRGSLVRGFLAATVKGIEEAVRAPKAAVDATMKVRPDADRDSLLAAAEQLGSFLHTKNSETKGAGWMAKEDWEETKRILVEYLGMSDTVSTESFYSNDFLPVQRN